MNVSEFIEKKINYTEVCKILVVTASSRRFESKKSVPYYWGKLKPKYFSLSENNITTVQTGDYKVDEPSIVPT
jgi:hypothetical protein